MLGLVQSLTRRTQELPSTSGYEQHVVGEGVLVAGPVSF